MKDYVAIFVKAHLNTVNEYCVGLGCCCDTVNDKEHHLRDVGHFAIWLTFEFYFILEGAVNVLKKYYYCHYELERMSAEFYLCRVVFEDEVTIGTVFDFNSPLLATLLHSTALSTHQEDRRRYNETIENSQLNEVPYSGADELFILAVDDLFIVNCFQLKEVS